MRAGTRPPRILFTLDDFCRDEIQGGGLRNIFSFAWQLRDAGLDANVVQLRPRLHSRMAAEYGGGIDPVGGPEFEVGPQDLLVVPEALTVRWHSSIPDGLRWVVLTQGAYLSFHLADLVPGERPSLYRDPDLIGAICVSRDSEKYLNYAFPWLDVRRVHLSVPSSLWEPPPTKHRRVALMPRRGADIARQVLNIAWLHGDLEGWDVDLIDDVSEQEAHERLREAAIFLSIPNPGGEGFGLPIAEAMAAGCAVVGFSGRGGDELMECDRAIQVPEGDVIALAKALSATLRRPIEELAEMGRVASEYVRMTYTPDRATSDLVEVVRFFLDKPCRATWDRAVVRPPIPTPRWRQASFHLIKAWRQLRR